MDDYFQVTVPEGKSGDWSVQRYTVTEEQAAAEKLHARLHGDRRHIDAGTYTGLFQGPELIMSDTHDEYRDLWPMLWEAKGRILINGLGLGYCTQACLMLPGVEHATVIEISPDVIALVAPHYQEMFGDRLTIINADAYEWSPPKGERYDAVWHDIWGDISSANVEGMKRLHRKYGRRTAWQGSWCRARCESGAMYGY